MTKLSKFAAIALVLIGIFLAIVAVVKQRSANAPELMAVVSNSQPSQSQVVVAKADLPAGHQITEADIELRPMAQVPASGSTNIQSLLGRSTAVEIAEGTPIETGSLLDGLAGLLQPGERAVSIKVEEFSAVGHKIKPGDWVDVFAVLRKDANEVEDTQARLLLPRKRILAFGGQLHPSAQNSLEKKDEQNAKPVEAPARTAVVAVKVDEVNRLVLAEQQGQVLLALRSPLDQSEPTEEAWSKAMGMHSTAQPKDASKLGQLAMDTSLEALTLTSLTHTSEVKPSHSQASSGVSRGRNDGVRVQPRRIAPVQKGTEVEVMRGTRSETVRY